METGHDVNTGHVPFSLIENKWRDVTDTSFGAQVLWTLWPLARVRVVPGHTLLAHHDRSFGNIIKTLDLLGLTIHSHGSGHILDEVGVLFGLGLLEGEGVVHHGLLDLGDVSSIELLEDRNVHEESQISVHVLSSLDGFLPSITLAHPVFVHMPTLDSSFLLLVLFHE